MRKYFLSVLIFSLVFGALVYQRLDTPEQHVVTVTRVEGESIYSSGDILSRGEIIETDEEFLHLSFDHGHDLYLAPRTTVELKRVFLEKPVIRFTRGRIVLSSHIDIPFFIETNHVSVSNMSRLVSMINFDFLETIHVIPFEGSVDVYLEQTDQTLLVKDSLGIHETPPVSTEPIQPDLSAGDAGAFYNWTGILTQ